MGFDIAVPDRDPVGERHAVFQRRSNLFPAYPPGAHAPVRRTINGRRTVVQVPAHLDALLSFIDGEKIQEIALGGKNGRYRNFDDPFESQVQGTGAKVFRLQGSGGAGSVDPPHTQFHFKVCFGDVQMKRLNGGVVKPILSL